MLGGWVNTLIQAGGKVLASVCERKTNPGRKEHGRRPKLLLLDWWIVVWGVEGGNVVEISLIIQSHVIAVYKQISGIEEVYPT